jgi:Zn-dependent M28 family amino/carboxypeptidase
VELRNVVAVLPGRSPRRIYVTGHYDSVARRTDGTGDRDGFDWTRADNDAPGANDDGSGTALVMELARVFAQSGVQFDGTLVFVAFAGEEEGLVGSTLHAGRASAAHWTIDAVLNNDIVGGSHGGDGVVDTSRVRVFSDGPEDSLSRSIARYVRQAGGALRAFAGGCAGGQVRSVRPRRRSLAVQPGGLRGDSPH